MTIKQNKIENLKWKNARLFIEHYQTKNGYINLSDISRQLNKNGYTTRCGCRFSPSTVKRLL